jgi:hypothetical protein
MLWVLSIESIRQDGVKNIMEFWPKTAISLHRCAMITLVFFDTLSDFALILALYRARIITIPTIHTSSY